MHTQTFPRFPQLIGLDNVLETFREAALNEVAPNYPPFNVEKLEDDQYRIEMAVAGFSPDDITIETDAKHLTVKAEGARDDKSRTFLHRGIALRGFTRSFRLVDHVRVQDATYRNGILSIELKREVPEALRPRKVEIKAAA